ncbi:hypothetical protein XU18_3560 [Perkinsela sp. CCAP 1560/4]|nr:hypothetical protein XU18_3560 [Perkinsela sp. CCAP 1560/4]|eukprot:KNH05389.1 hypothetical protein XU18_3560 [Perkinsela sp. CCAP 1560/4]
MVLSSTRIGTSWFSIPREKLGSVTSSARITRRTLTFHPQSNHHASQTACLRSSQRAQSCNPRFSSVGQIRTRLSALFEASPTHTTGNALVHENEAPGLIGTVALCEI